MNSSKVGLDEFAAAVRRLHCAGDPRMLAITAMAAKSHAWHDENAADLRERARQVLTEGAIPGLREALGIAHREVPINRTLGWLLNPTSSHGAGVPLLRSFATWLGADVVASDPTAVGVWCERVPADWPSTRPPDLLFRGPHGALLVENKVNAKEGPSQFKDYAAAFERWRGSHRVGKLVVMARQSRTVPVPYEFRSHTELGWWAQGEAVNLALPAWIRAVLLMLANDLLNVNLATNLPEIQRLLDVSLAESMSSVATIRLARALPRPQFPQWRLP